MKHITEIIKLYADQKVYNFLCVIKIAQKETSETTFVP